MYRVSDISEDTILYAASYGTPDCDAEGTVIGFRPQDVDKRITSCVEAAQRYAAENCTIIEASGERDAEPEDFPYWITDAMEMRVGDIVIESEDQWPDVLDMLKHYGYADVSRS